MCRYMYGTDKYEGGRCAHPSNHSIECKGEGSCRLMWEETALDTNDIVEEYGSAVEKEGDSCHDTTCGVYCSKYKLFYCAGKGNCQTEEEYREHMSRFSGGL